MPTARELLEQADALMRRNRGGDSGIPVLTDRVAGSYPAPGRSGPSTRDRTGAAARAQPADGRAPREKGSREDQNQTPPAQEATGRGPTASDRLPPASDALSAEPPVLTDAVDELAVEIVPLAAANTEDDHSLWLGPDTIDPALHSITGPAPDTVAVVPPVTLRAAEPKLESFAQDEDRDPTVTRTLRAAGSAPTPPPAGSMPPARAEVLAEAPPADERDPTVTRTLRAEGSAPTPLPAGSMPPAPAEVPAEAAPADERDPTVMGTLGEAGSAPTPAEVPAEAAAGSARTGGPGDDDRWRALAEQISMQVLQRLDLFIDTGLKVKLASHLQPIVARASAELVETINDHVGQLVRTYVAEAIEREIAQWRQQNK